MMPVQDISQLRKNYGKESADVIFNIVGNIFSGQVLGDTAKQLSERFGKIMQDRKSLSINSQDTWVSRSKQLESAIPPSRIASLSSGEFAAAVADSPTEKIEPKTFHCEILNDHDPLKQEEDAYIASPKVRETSHAEIEENYTRIKQEMTAIIDTEMERIYDTPEPAHLIVVRKE